MEQMQKQQAEARNANSTHQTTAQTAPKEEPVEAEYIEFEEVKKN